MQDSTQLQEDVETKVMLQVRMLYRDETGVVRDETRDTNRSAHGLAWLQEEGRNAVSGLIRTRELLQLLALAAEERSEVPGELVQRVLDEIEDELADFGDLGGYVRSVQDFLERAEALPTERSQEGEALDHSSALIESAS